MRSEVPGKGPSAAPLCSPTAAALPSRLWTRSAVLRRRRSDVDRWLLTQPIDESWKTAKEEKNHLKEEEGPG